MFKEEHRQATWTNVMYMVFRELSGTNVMVLYSSMLFTDMDEESKGFSLTPR